MNEVNAGGGAHSPNKRTREFSDLSLACEFAQLCDQSCRKEFLERSSILLIPFSLFILRGPQGRGVFRLTKRQALPPLLLKQNQIYPQL